MALVRPMLPVGVASRPLGGAITGALFARSFGASGAGALVVTPRLATSCVVVLHPASGSAKATRKHVTTSFMFIPPKRGIIPSRFLTGGESPSAMAVLGDEHAAH